MQRPWMVALAALNLLGATGGVLADVDVFDPDGQQPGWLCEQCRDPAAHPEDFAAFAYNAYWGPDAWAWDSILGIPFRIYNLELQWVAVWFEDFFLDAPSLLPNTMQIKLRLNSGEVISIEVLQDGPNMPIGADDGAGHPGDGCFCTSGGESNILGNSSFNPKDSFDDFAFYVWKMNQMPVGRVEIIDM